VPQEARVVYRDSKFNQIGYTLAPFLMEFVCYLFFSFGRWLLSIAAYEEKIPLLSES